MNKYFRITGYEPINDFCFILDCFGLYEQIWQFSSFLVKKGIKVLAVGSDEKFLDVNIAKAQEDKEHFILRANAKGSPENVTQELNGIKYQAIKVADKIYIPNREARL